MTDVISKILKDICSTVWDGVNDVFSSAAGALVAIVVAIVLSIFPTWVLLIAAIALFIGISHTQYKETLDKDSE